LRCSEIWYRGFDDAVLVMVLPVVVAPVEARVVDWRSVPGLENVDLSVSWPGEGFEREQPECGPNALYKSE
jgi:hypothetical protein